MSRITAVPLRVLIGSFLAALALALPQGAAATPPAAEGGLEQIEGQAGCVQQTTAVIAPCRPAHALDEPVGIAISPDGLSVYVAARNPGSVAVFKRNAKSGALTQLEGADGCWSERGPVDGCQDGLMLDGANSVVVSPDAQNVYVGGWTNDSIAIFSRDLDSGALTQLPGQNGCIRDSGGPGTPCLDGEAMRGVFALAFSPDGLFLYAAAATSNAIAVFSRDPGSGRLTQVTFQSSQSHLGLVRDLAVSPDGRNLYALADGANDEDLISMWSRNPVDGTIGPLGSPSCISDKGTYCVKAKALNHATAVEVSPDGTWVGVAGNESNALTIFRRLGDGSLVEGGCARTGVPAPCLEFAPIAGAYRLAISPDSSNVYVGTEFVGVVSGFTAPNAQPRYLNVIGGCVSPPGGGCNEALELAQGLSPVVSPDGKNVYVASAGADAVVVLMRQLAPQCGDDSARTSPGVAVEITLGCEDPNGTAVTHSITSAPLNGTLGPIDQAAGKVTYTPNPGFVGTDTFSFTASDGGVTAVPASIRITVEADTQPPLMGIRTGKARMNAAGRISISVFCPASEESCTGTLSVRRKGVALGKRSFADLPGGLVLRVTVRLNLRGRNLVNELDSVRVQIRATAHDPAGNVGTRARTITILAPRS